MKTNDSRRGWRKLQLALGALMLACSSHAQGTVEMLFTNKVVTFTNLQGAVYKDADLIRASSRDVIFKTNGDFGTVALTNLNEAAFQRLGIPMEFVQLAFDSERQKSDAVARDRALFQAEQLVLRNPSNLVRISLMVAPDKREYNATYGFVSRALVRMPDGKSALVYIARLPIRIPEWFEKENSLEKAIADLGNRAQTGSMQIALREEGLKQRQLEIDKVDAVTPRVFVQEPYYGYYYDPYIYQRSAINLAQVEQKYAVSNLDETKGLVGSMQEQMGSLQAQLNAMKQAELSATSVMVLFSRFTQNGSRMAVCAPEELQGANQ
jgi:hypothetical protein